MYLDFKLLLVTTKLRGFPNRKLQFLIMFIAIDASQVKFAEADGITNYSYHILRALSQLKTSHKFLLFFKHPPFSKVQKNLFVDNPAFEFRVLGSAPFWRQTALAKACLKEKPDLLFLPIPTLPIIRKSSLKTVITVHDLCFDYLPERYQFPQKMLLGKAEKYASYAASRVIAVSEATKKALLSEFNADSRKIDVVYEGVDQEKFNPLAGGSNYKLQEQREEKIRKKYGIGGDYVFFVGTIQPRKNLRRMIEAFSEVSKTFAFPNPPDLSGRVFPTEVDTLQLVIAGRPGWLFDDIYSAPKDFGVEDKVKFLGGVPGADLPLLYKNAKVLLFPSLCEGFGLPILEAMSSGCPVITSNISSMPEVGGDAVFYVNPRDVKDIARGLQTVLTDDKLRQTLISNGKKRAAEFSWQSAAKGTLRVFEAC